MASFDERLNGRQPQRPCAVGYSDPKGQVIVRNSWAASWGDKGYCYMPYQYLTGPAASSDSASIEGPI